jgi:hypothetical protein
MKPLQIYIVWCLLTILSIVFLKEDWNGRGVVTGIWMAWTGWELFLRDDYER